MTGMSIRVSGTWRAAKPSVKVSGTWRAVANGFVKVSGVWRQFYANAIVVTGSTTAYGACARHGVGSCTAITAAATVTVTGGTGAYSYSWEYVSGEAANIQNPSDPSTTFWRLATTNSTHTGVYRCKVTDTGSGVVTYGPNVTVTTQHENDV